MMTVIASPFERLAGSPPSRAGGSTPSSRSPTCSSTRSPLHGLRRLRRPVRVRGGRPPGRPARRRPGSRDAALDRHRLALPHRRASCYGGWWSYRTLGWGGYWAWDPVENASFMPWLMGTAFVHSVMVQERRPMLKIWNMTLITLTFALTIFGTFLTRSGVIIARSTPSPSGAIGPFLLAYLAAILLTSLGLLVWRWDRLGERAELDALLSRESVFLLNNVLLVAFCFTVFIGTIFPLLSEAVTGAKVSVGTPYFNWVSVPILLVTLLLMGAGPLVPWRRGSWRGPGAAPPGARPPSPSARASCTWLVGDSRSGSWVSATRSRTSSPPSCWASSGGRRGAAAARPASPGRRPSADCSPQNHRRYGGLVVHLGVVLVAIGVATSTVGKVEREATLKKGETLEVGRYAVRFTGLSAGEQPTTSWSRLPWR